MTAPAPGRRRRTALRAAAVVLACLGAGVVVAGCGGGGSAKAARPAKSHFAGLTPEEVFLRAQTALATQPSVHIAGHFMGDGQNITIDAHIVNGKGGSGTVQVDGAALDLVRVGTRVWIRGDAAFFKAIEGEKSSDDTGPRVADRWLKAPLDDPDFDDFNDLFDTSVFVRHPFELGVLTLVAGRPVDGVPTVGVKVDAKPDPLIMLVADDGTDIPVQLEGTGGQRVTFSEWGKPFKITPPPADEVIDLPAIK